MDLGVHSEENAELIACYHGKPIATTTVSKLPVSMADSVVASGATCIDGCSGRAAQDGRLATRL